MATTASTAVARHGARANRRWLEALEVLEGFGGCHQRDFLEGSKQEQEQQQKKKKQLRPKENMKICSLETIRNIRDTPGEFRNKKLLLATPGPAASAARGEICKGSMSGSGSSDRYRIPRVRYSYLVTSIFVVV